METIDPQRVVSTRKWKVTRVRRLSGEGTRGPGVTPYKGELTQ